MVGVRTICLLLACCFLGTASSEAGLWDRLSGRKMEQVLPPTIKVLLLHDQPGAMLEMKGPYRIYDPNTGDHISTRLMGKRRYMLPMTEGLQWGEEFPGVHQLMFTPDNHNSTMLVDGVEYKGNLYVYSVEGVLSVVNEVLLEDYVKSVMSKRFRDPMDEELFAAIAIAMRTDALYHARHPATYFWAVDAKEVGYVGSVIVLPFSPVAAAVDATRHLVLSQAQMGREEAFPIAPGTLFSKRLDLPQAEKKAHRGDNAAQILADAFPNTLMRLDYPLAVSRD